MRTADEMSTEVMENAANAATKRRELRRRRILMDPGERMRKLTGQNNANQGPVKTNYSTDPMLNGGDAAQDMYGRMAPIEDFSSHHYDNQFVPMSAAGLQQQPQQYQHQEQQPTFGTEPNFANFANLFQSQNLTGTVGLGAQQAQTMSATGKLAPSQAFTRGRHLVYFILGIMVRVALIYSLGRRFVQSIINPFVFAEVAFLGYQRAVGMDLGANIKGGLWLSTLLLSGIRSDVVDAYKTGMGVITSILDDFSLYFFAFVVVHLVCLPFA